MIFSRSLFAAASLEKNCKQDVAVARSIRRPETGNRNCWGLPRCWRGAPYLVLRISGIWQIVSHFDGHPGLVPPAGAEARTLCFQRLPARVNSSEN